MRTTERRTTLIVRPDGIIAVEGEKPLPIEDSPSYRLGVACALIRALLSRDSSPSMLREIDEARAKEFLLNEETRRKMSLDGK